jgi:hypothetical protein
MVSDRDINSSRAERMIKDTGSVSALQLSIGDTSS